MSCRSRSNMFVVFEGCDFSGKTTTARKLCKIIGGRFIESPPAPFSGIKQEILEEATPLARFYFFLASNIQVSETTKRLLTKTHVVCDRYVWSTIAYHAARENIPPTHLMSLARPIFNLLAMPSFVVFLTVNRTTQIFRSRNRTNNNLQRDLLQSELFQRRLRKAYDVVRTLDDNPWIEIDTSSISVNETAQAIVSKIKKYQQS